MNSDIYPPEKLLDAVEEIAAISAKLPLSQQSIVDSGELHIASTDLPNGSKEYKVWGLIDYLVFVKDSDGRNHVMKYVKANWEDEIYKLRRRFKLSTKDTEAQEYWGPMVNTSQDKPEISKGFLDKVKVLAQARITLSADKMRQITDLGGVTCECDFLPDGSLDYRVGDQTATHLHLKIEDGSIIIMEYKLGDWMQRLDSASALANVLMTDAESDFKKMTRNLSDKIPNAQNVIERVEYAKKIAQLRPLWAGGWEILYLISTFAGLDKDAARAATIALNLEPYNASAHELLSTIYFKALIDSRYAASLGCTSSYARQVVEKHCREALKLSKDERINKAVEEMMNVLHGNEYIDGQAELFTACKLCELDPRNVLDEISALVRITNDKAKSTVTMPPAGQHIEMDKAVEVWMAWWGIFVGQYGQKCVEWWATKCKHIRDYKKMKELWADAFEPLWSAGCNVEKSIRLKEIVDPIRHRLQTLGNLSEDDQKAWEAWMKEVQDSSDKVASAIIADFKLIQNQSIEATLSELPQFDQASLLGKLKRLIYDYGI